jgi:hypothetical protein
MLFPLNKHEYNDLIVSFDTNKYDKKDIMDATLLHIDLLTRTFLNKSILSELNDLQISFKLSDKDHFEGSVFSQKDTIPLEFINLVLYKYNLELIKE